LVPYLITAVVLLLVLSPVVMMMPSPRQRRQALLRERARKLGIDVRVAELPQTHRQRVRREPVEQGLVYRLPQRDGWHQVRAHLRCRASAADEWEVQEGSPALTEALEAAVAQVAARVPTDAVAIELAATGPAIYWREHGNEQAVERVHGLLSELVAALKNPVEER